MGRLVAHVTGALFLGLISFVLLGRHEHASSIRCLPLFAALGYVVVIAFMMASSYTNWQLLKASLASMLCLEVLHEIVGHVWFIGLAKYDDITARVIASAAFVTMSTIIMFSGFVACKLLLRLPSKEE